MSTNLEFQSKKLKIKSKLKINAEVALKYITNALMNDALSDKI